MHALMSLISLAESLNHHLVHRKLVLNVCLRFEWALCFGHVISSHFILLSLAHFSALAWLTFIRQGVHWFITRYIYRIGGFIVLREAMKELIDHFFGLFFVAGLADWYSAFGWSFNSCLNFNRCKLFSLTGLVALPFTQAIRKVLSILRILHLRVTLKFLWCPTWQTWVQIDPKKLSRMFILGTFNSTRWLFIQKILKLLVRLALEKTCLVA